MIKHVYKTSGTNQYVVRNSALLVYTCMLPVNVKFFLNCLNYAFDLLSCL